MKRAVLGLLGWYRQYRALRPPACRFSPSCSAYVTGAVEAHGVAKGLYLGLRRVLRCHPLGGHGYDPVPAVAASGAPLLSKAIATSREPRSDEIGRRYV